MSEIEPYVKISPFSKTSMKHFSSVQSLSHVRLFASQASLSITNSQSSLKLMSLELVMSSNHLICCRPFSSCLYSFSVSGSFPVSQYLVSGGQSIGASASVIPMNIQDWFPLGWTGLISLQSKGLSRVFSNTTVQILNSLVLSFLYSLTLTSIHDYWKNHSFD